MSSGERFGPAFEVPAGGFCFLRWPPPLRPRLSPVVPGGVDSVWVPRFHSWLPRRTAATRFASTRSDPLPLRVSVAMSAGMEASSLQAESRLRRRLHDHRLSERQGTMSPRSAQLVQLRP